MTTTPDIVDLMRERVTDEIFHALGWKKRGTLRRAFGWLFYLPTQRFARIFARADEAVSREGIPGGCRSVLSDLGVRVHARGTEHLAGDGPLVIASNHPGAYDSIALAASTPRPDLRIIVYEVPFYRAMPHTDKRFIYAREHSDPTGRMITLRAAIQHLREGEALLQFGTGKIEPDPEVMPGAEEALQAWSPSLEVMLRKAPDTRLVLAIASGVLLRRFAYHPLTRLRPPGLERRRLAEYLQVITQLVSPRSVAVTANISFAPPVTTGELLAETNGGRLMPAIQARAKRLLHEHMAALPA